MVRARERGQDRAGPPDRTEPLLRAASLYSRLGVTQSMVRIPAGRSLGPPGEQREGVRQAPAPGRRYGGDDLAEGPLPFHCPASRERVVDVGAGEVAAILADPRLVLVPRHK